MTWDLNPEFASGAEAPMPQETDGQDWKPDESRGGGSGASEWGRTRSRRPSSSRVEEGYREASSCGGGAGAQLLRPSYGAEPAPPQLCHPTVQLCHPTATRDSRELSAEGAPERGVTRTRSRRPSLNGYLPVDGNNEGAC
eukprot:5006865-Pyramimonas_sp.AAC.1